MNGSAQPHDAGCLKPARLATRAATLDTQLARTYPRAMHSNLGARMNLDEVSDADHEMFRVARSRRRRSMLISASLAVVVLGGGGFVALRAASRTANTHLAKAWSGVAACLGTKASATPQQAWRRVRDVQLVAMGLPVSARSNPGQKPWPQSCASYAYSVSETLRFQRLEAAADPLGRGGSAKHWKAKRA